MSDSERQDVIPICKTFHTSAHTLSHRYDILELYVPRHKYIAKTEMNSEKKICFLQIPL